MFILTKNIMYTEIKTIGNQEYICLMTNDVNKGDFIIKSFDNGVEKSINKITFANKKQNILRYDKISGDGNHSFGIDRFRKMTDMSKYTGRKCLMELDILHAKIIGIGNRI